MSWISEVSIQRRSLYSNGIIVLTDDCKRISQLISAMKANYPKPVILKKNSTTTRERWLILDGWDGLQEIKRDSSGEDWIIETLADAKKFGGGIKKLLPVVSKELEKGDTVLIIQNLLQTNESINSALLSWSTSDKLRSVDSTVLIFIEDINILPQNVWSKMKAVDVPKSLPDERGSMITEDERVMGAINKLDEQEKRAAVRLLAGMNLDQIDASIIESLVRNHYIDLDAVAKTKEELLGKDPVLDIIQRPKFGFEAIGGYDALKERLRNDIILPLRYPEVAERYGMDSPRGVILFGPPGTGKTILTKAMSREMNMSVLAIKQENFMSKYVGESERSLKRAFSIADSMAPSIVFIDELDRLAKRSGGGGDSGAQVHKEIFSMFLEKLGDENRKWFFVGCTNRIEDIDEAMRRTGRVDSIAPVPFPDEKARREIFRIHATVKRDLPLNDDISFETLANNNHTYMWSGSDVEQLVIRTAKEVMKESIQQGGKIRNITMDDFERMINTFNVDQEANAQLQEHIKEQAKRLSNDNRLLNIFDEAQTIRTDSRQQKAKEMMS